MGELDRPSAARAAALAVLALLAAPALAGDEHDPWQWEVAYPVWIHVDGIYGDDDSYCFGLYPDAPVRTLRRAVALLSDPAFPYHTWPWIRLVLQRGTFRQAQNPLAPLPWEEVFPIVLPDDLAQVSIEAEVPFGAAIEVVPVLSLDPVFVRHAGTDVRFLNLRIETHNPDVPLLARPLIGTLTTGVSASSPLVDAQLTVIDSCSLLTSGALAGGTAWEPGLHRVAVVDTLVDLSPSMYSNPFAVDLQLQHYGEAPPRLEVLFQRTRVRAGAPLRTRRWGWTDVSEVSFLAYNSDFEGYTHQAVLVDDTIPDGSSVRLEIWHCAMRAAFDAPGAGPPRAVVVEGVLLAGAPSSIRNTVFRGHEVDLTWGPGTGWPAALDVRSVASDAQDLAGTPGFVPIGTAESLFLSDFLDEDCSEAHVLPGTPLADAGVWPVAGNAGEVDRSIYGEARDVSGSFNLAPDIGPDESWSRRLWIDHQPAPGESFTVRTLCPPGEVPFLGIDLSPMPASVPPLEFDPTGVSLFVPSTWWTGLWIELLPPAVPLPGGAGALSTRAFQLAAKHPNPAKWPNPGQWLHLQAGFVDPVTLVTRYSVNDAYLFASE